MNCFQLVKTVLDDLYNEIYEEHGDLADNVIELQLLYLREAYRDLEGFNLTSIDYNDPATRFAYVYRYTTAHANILFDRIDNLEVLRDAFKNEKLSLGCIGGGPGSDILGVLKFLNLYKDVSRHLKKLTFTICDKEQAWNETWHDVDNRIDDFVSMSASYHFLPMDVTEGTSLRTARRIASADIFTMIYFVSEIYAYKEDAREFFEYLFDVAKPGALLFFVDNSRQTFYQWFDEVASSKGLEIVEKDDYFQFQTDGSEDKEALGRYYNKFGYPKLRADIAYRLYRKEIAQSELVF